jgi:gliding motility-associated-like protein
VATVTDAQGCVKTIAAEITQPEPLLADVVVEDVACHGGRNGRISINMLGGTPGYQFSIDNRNFNGANIMAGMRAGYYVIYVKDAKGCTLLTEATIKEPEPFSVDAGQSSYTISLGDTLLLTAMAFNAQGSVEFVWSAQYGNTLSCTECDTTAARPTNQITYELYGVDAKGCEATDLVTVFVEKERIALVPTGFTPNQDGQNDRLLVHGRQGTKVRFFRVFDRWGQLIYQGNDFQVNDQASGWDGFFKGSPAQTGVYIWHLEVEYPDGLVESYKGQTTLIR